MTAAPPPFPGGEIDVIRREHELAAAFTAWWTTLDETLPISYTAAFRAGAAWALERAARAIQVACSMCGGQGWTAETGSEHHPRCDGSCSQGLCPVPVPIQEQCEYCGRPIEAIRSIAAPGEARKDE